MGWRNCPVNNSGKGLLVRAGGVFDEWLSPGWYVGESGDEPGEVNRGHVTAHWVLGKG